MYKNPAGRAGASLPRAHPTTTERGEPGRPIDHSQAQPRVKIMAVKQVQGQRGKPVHSTGEQNNTVLDHTGPQMTLNKTPTSNTVQEKAKAPKPELK